MTCGLCADKGVVRIGYHEPPSEGYVDYGICGCRRGLHLRGPHARAMIASRYGVTHEQVNLIEELLDAEDLPDFQTMNVIPEVYDVTDAGRRVRKAKL